MTATSLGGRPRRFEDGFGSPFEVRDHRRLYRFQYDKYAERYLKKDTGWDFEPDDRSDFKSTNSQALVHAARASAGFPVAFPPISEDRLLDFRQHPDTDYDREPSCVMDGGVLNNAPFGPVLEAITRRQMDTVVTRAVVYVVPSAGQGAQKAEENDPCHETWFVKPALSSLEFPREVDFRIGTQELAERLGNSVRDTQLGLFRRMHEDPNLGHYVRESAQRLINEYRLSRAGAVLFEVRNTLAEAGTVTTLVATPQADEDPLVAIITRNPNWCPLYGDYTMPGPGKMDDWSWRWGIITAERLLETLRSHLERLASDNRNQQDALIAGASEISRQLRKALAVKDAVRTQIHQRHGDAQYTDDKLADLLTEVFQDLDVPTAICQLVLTAGNSYANALKKAGMGNPQGHDVINDCLAVEVVTRAYAPPGKITGPLTPTFKFLRLGPDTVSPLFDEERQKRIGDGKLFGIRFNHFGAFIDRQWRRSDFAWGRLDAAHHLLRLLVPEATKRPEWERKLHEAILEAERSTSRRPGNVAEAKVWMTGNLSKLEHKTDRALLREVVSTREGQKSLKAVIDSALRLLGSPAPQRASGAIGKAWHNALHYARPVAARSGTSLRSQDKRWLRWLTVHIRRRALHTYDNDELWKVPKAARTAAWRTAVVILAAILAIGSAIGAVAAVGGPAILVAVSGCTILAVGGAVGASASSLIRSIRGRRRAPSSGEADIGSGQG